MSKVQRVGLGLQWTTTKGVKYKSNIKCKIKERKKNNLKYFSEMTFSRNKEGMDALLLFTVSPLFYFLQNSFTKYPLFHIIFRRKFAQGTHYTNQVITLSLSYFFSLAFIKSVNLILNWNKLNPLKIKFNSCLDYFLSFKGRHAPHTNLFRALLLQLF